MDIPLHILDAVQTGGDFLSSTQAASAAAVAPSSSSRPSSRKVPSIPRLSRMRSAHSSAEDVSTTSESDHEHGYQTDFTSPPSSESCPDDMHTDDVEEFRDREYPQLKGKTYLDHGGTTLYARSLVEEFSADLIANLYGNPHSASTPSAVSGHRIDAIRERALRFFNADPDEFDLVFVANATAAIKLVIECFKDYAASTNTPVWYGYHRDAHTSLVGVRESTKMHRCFTSDEEIDIWINSGGFGGPRARQLGLFAFPGQSNMTGRRLPLSWPGRIRKSFHKAATYTLLDAAALASTAPLDLSDPATAPDFVALSFYKIFGFPNIGALLVRKDSAHVLQSRRYFGGGTVDMIITINDTWHAKKDTTIHDRLEDGTLPFHSIFALDHAMNVHERLYGPNPMKFISHHTAQLGKQLYDGLCALRHANGTAVCQVYKDDVAVYGDPTLQGSTVAFNVIRADGSLVGYEEVEEAADERNIFVRSGSLCNPGGVATYLNWSPAEMRAAYAAGHRCTNPTQVMFGRPTGVVRVSLGAMSTASDVRTLLRFLDDLYVEKAAQAHGAAAAAATAAVAQTTPAASTPGTPAAALASSPSPSPFQHYHPFSNLPKQQPPYLTTSTTTATATATTNPDDAISPVVLPAVERPRFVPADYIKMRKPWEDEMRRQHAQLQQQQQQHLQQQQQQQQTYAMEIKVRELDESSVSRTTTGGTPSVKARKFGRSVVNLLRTRSHLPDAGANNNNNNNSHNDHHSRHPPPPLPVTSLVPDHSPQLKEIFVSNSSKHPGSTKSEKSRRSLERAMFQSNVEALGI